MFVCLTYVEIHFKKPVTGERAAALKAMCPLDVFDIEDMGSGSGSSSTSSDAKAVAARPRDCTMCRECIRTGDWADYIELRRISDHFIFSVETVGCLAPERIVRDVSTFISWKSCSIYIYIPYSNCGLFLFFFL